MNKSEQIDKLAEALAKAQGVFRPAKMASTNPFFKSKYADLGEIIEAGKNACANNGLAVSQPVSFDDGKVTVNTILLHASGQWIESSMTMTLGESRGSSPAQAAGSLITYLRRYSLAAVLGIYADEDVDGNDDHANPKNNTPAPAKASAEPVKNAPETRQEARTAIKTAEKAENVLPPDSDAKPAKTPPVRPYAPAILKEGLVKESLKRSKETVDPKHTQHVAAVLGEILQGDDKRHELIKWLTDSKGSLKDVGPGYVSALYHWLKPSYDPNAQRFSWDETAAKEAEAAHTEAMRANGAQGALFEPAGPDVGDGPDDPSWPS